MKPLASDDLDSFHEPGIDISPERPLKFYARVLVLLFVLSLPLVNPIVHGDGVGYYAYARAPLIQHNLRFEEDWRHANSYFSMVRTRPDGQLFPSEYTTTGHVSNLFSVGPAMLWSPLLLFAHCFVVIADALGAHIAADGFSFPYRLAMAAGTALYGFLGLLFSFSLAAKYVQARWAFLATLGVWTASSLPVYMYFNPAWSHAHSAFAVTLFLWFWDRTRNSRTAIQWILLGLLAGLMVDVYFPNGVFLLLPLAESLLAFWKSYRSKDAAAAGRLLFASAVFAAAGVVALLPTFVTRAIIFGGIFRFGSYTELPWDWSAPNWRVVLFSSEHGLLSWTPILALAVAGLFLAPRAAKVTTLYLGAAGAAFYYVISSYPYWHGMASFGNRFFISLTPVFIFGLALFLQRVSVLVGSPRRATSAVSVCLFLLAAWNAGFIFQWGTHLVPPRGAISWKQMAFNQFFVVPRELSARMRDYLFRRKALMQQIEERDIDELRNNPPQP